MYLTFQQRQQLAADAAARRAGPHEPTSMVRFEDIRQDEGPKARVRRFAPPETDDE